MLLSPPAAAAREAHCSDAVNAVIIGMFSSYRISTLSQTLKLLDYEKEKKKREIESGEQSEDHCIHCITASAQQARRRLPRPSRRRRQRRGSPCGRRISGRWRTSAPRIYS
jgi:hypothetical protein